MKLGTNLKHTQKIRREQESYNRIMPFEVSSLKILSTVSFFKTINDVVGASHLDSHLRCIHEIIYKYTALSDDVQRKRSITLHSVLTEWCPLYCRSFSDYPGAPVPQWVKR